MAARKYKRRRKRRGGSFILSLLTFCIVIAAIVTSVTVFLKVAEIEVSGTTRYDPQAIIETSGIKTGDNMFMMNKFEVAERILDRYPYIEQIKIRRRLPDTFTFEITERTPAAYVMSGENRWLIDKKGYILEMLGDEEVKLPKICGTEVLTPHTGSEVVFKNEAQLQPLREVLHALSVAEMTENVKRIELAKLYDISIVYEDRFLISLGDTTELARKIEMLKAVLGELSEFDRGTINVSAIKEARFKPNANIDLSEKSAPLPGPIVPPTVEELSPEDAAAAADDNTEEKTEEDNTEIPPQ